MLTLSNGATVQGTSGSPASADAVVAAVAQPSAHWTGPLILLLHLQDVLPIPHEQTVSTQNSLHKHEWVMSMKLWSPSHTGSLWIQQQLLK